MMKMLRKKRKGGFTLIELIVVIAILGILAAIAIPRFSGFTDKAKIAADKQYVALVAESMTVLKATNDIAGTGVVTVASTGVVTVAAGITNFTAAKLAALVPVKPFTYYTTAVTFTLAADGSTTAPAFP